HPARILALAGSPGAEPKLDAQVRIGGDAGASEVVLLNLSGPLRSHSEAVITPLLVPDAPIVAWWPNHAPAHPGEHPIGKVAKLRITDSNHCSNAREVLDRLAAGYRPGDSDLAWTRLTGWRAQIAAALDIAGSDPVTGVIVEAMPDRASAWLLAGWLAIELQCPTEYVPVPNAVGISSVTLQRASGDIVFSRPDGHTLSIKQPGFPERQIALPLTSLSEALTEELRRLDTDRVYEKVLTKGRALVSSPDTASPAAQEVAA
ncbi:MAG: glucose-6-phosphate dehydrogenase assembly protein OpcA, partial [Cellulomonadaceae bacterium]|nr:glucose-6-phosphate dehydrogenase assembly protein OpcA [Cellulomonadaceae bacterium]